MGQAYDLGGLDVTVNSLLVGASGPGQAGTNISTTENATTVNVGASGTAGTINVFPATASKGKLVIDATNNTGNTSTTITNAAMGQASVISIPDPGAATANFVLDAGTATSVTATTVNAATTANVGSSGTAGTLSVFPTTATTGKTTLTASSNSGNTTTAINTASQAGARTYTVPDAGASASFVMTQGTQTISGATTLSSVPNATFSAGTTSIAPINLTAGTNLTTATAGAIEFDGTVFYATSAASSRQQIDAEQYTIATNDSATYSSNGLDQTTTPVPVFTTTMGGSANGAVTLAAGKTYAFEACYILTNTGTTSHTWATLFGGTATLTSILYQAYGLSSTSSAPATGGLTGYATAATATTVTAASTSATENVTIMLNGVVTINAGGTFIPQMQASARPGASGTPGVVVKKGSFFRIWEMAGTGTLGNWS